MNRPSNPSADDQRRYGAYAFVETCEGRGPTVWRSICDSMVRIEERCKALGIPETDMRLRSAKYLTDGRHSFVRGDERIEDPRTLECLQNIRRQVLLHELALHAEPPANGHNGGLEASERVREHVEEASVSVIPMVRFLEMVDIAADRKQSA